MLRTSLEPSEGRGQVATPHKDQDLSASSLTESSSLSGRESQCSMITDGSQAGSSIGYLGCGGVFFLMAAMSREMSGSSEGEEQLKIVT